MRPLHSTQLSLILLAVAAAALLLQTSHSEEPAVKKENKYTAEVDKLMAAPAPAPGGILLIGSSIFRKWTSFAEALAPLPVTNRAFGGSKTSDQLAFFDRLVPSSRAALIVWYCGSNDVKGKKPPSEIVARTKEWIALTQKALPSSRILLVSVVNAPQKRRDEQSAAVNDVNQGLSHLAETEKGVSYIDVNPALEASGGDALTGCYVEDLLHFTPEGYERMAAVLKPAMERDFAATAKNEIR
jgi:lysophospholipase L1-like esterase